MKKAAVLGLLLILCVNVLLAAIDYTTVDPLSLPTYTGSLNDPTITIVYEDAIGRYILVEIAGLLYTYYL